MHLKPLIVLTPSLPHAGTRFIDARNKTLSRGTDRGMAYAKFKPHQFSYLNITSIGSDYVLQGSECGLVCVNIPSCFSFNLGAFRNVIGKVICELLPSDIYNNSEKFVLSQSHHHYSIASPCISWPCQNKGTCAAQYQENSYVCVCAKGYTGKHCELGKNIFDGRHMFLLTGAKDCGELYNAGKRSNGVYIINPDGSGDFHVYCDHTTSGGGWTVFQKRLDGSVSFYRDWSSYKYGFGYTSSEFWLGLENIRRLTSSEDYELRIDMEDFTGTTVYAEYTLFEVESEGSNYKLNLGSYSGTAGDSFSYHDGYPFTTKDRDNDSHGKGINCGKVCTGGWWYRHCWTSNLNGHYYQGYYKKPGFWQNGVAWHHWKGNDYSLKRTEMKIRSVNF
ncbi:hypothetical protein pdam_00001885 [Pocillopora damicornis]|uniref:Fibrinogen C-terminal domain-containing protein n=1 Tax=Pocillopora damicornis TaxID=46731 RepID=A0A3M6TPX9_POCDA|nr:hypothetical protein pdam_00001885 [Pocillopora damicornis]